MKGWNAASTPVSMAAQFLESTCFQDETFSESENFTNFIDGNEDIQWEFSENFDDDSLNVYLLYTCCIYTTACSLNNLNN